MEDVLGHRPAWYLAGPAIGLVVVAVLATLNERLGVVGGYSELLERARRRSWTFGWKACFLFGVVGGGFVFALLGGAPPTGEGYGWLSRAFDGDRDLAVPALLLVSGALIGYGAKTAGGCTSGNGLSGCSLGSPASMVATMTFMATAVATAFATSVLLGS